MNELSLWGENVKLIRLKGRAVAGGCSDNSEQCKCFYMKYRNRSIGHSLSRKLSLVRSAENIHQIWRTLAGSLTFFLPLAVGVRN